MPIINRYQIDIFTIVVLILILVLLIFMVLAIVYFSRTMNFQFPTHSESLFMFWMAIILTIVLLGVFIYAMFRIFTYSVPVYVEQTTVMEPRIVETVRVVEPVRVVKQQNLEPQVLEPQNLEPQVVETQVFESQISQDQRFNDRIYPIAKVNRQTDDFGTVFI